MAGECEGEMRVQEEDAAGRIRRDGVGWRLKRNGIVFPREGGASETRSVVRGGLIERAVWKRDDGRFRWRVCRV